MTAEIIGGGACNYSLVVVKIPQIRAQILGLCESAKVKARLSIYRSCRDVTHVVYGRRTLWWTPGPVCLFFLLASVLQDASSIKFILRQSREGGRAHATRASATRYSVAVARLARVLATPQLATAGARHRALQARCGCSARAEDAAARRKLGPTTPSRRSDLQALSTARAQRTHRCATNNGAPPRARRVHNPVPTSPVRRGGDALSASAQSGARPRRQSAGRRRAAERRPGRRRRALPFITKTIGLRDRWHGFM